MTRAFSSEDKIELPFHKSKLTAEQLIEIADRFEDIVEEVERTFDSTTLTSKEKKQERLLQMCYDIAKDYKSKWMGSTFYQRGTNPPTWEK
tara:strand:- start:1071 stop:1343 length:273 start_codon:yes stop_codon:yes gene_type:complete